MPVVLQCIALVAWGHDVAYGVVHLTVTYLMACCCREARRMLLVVEHGHRHDLLVIVVWACRGILAVPAMQVVIVPVVREFFLVADLAADGRYLLTVTCPLSSCPLCRKCCCTGDQGVRCKSIRRDSPGG